MSFNTQDLVSRFAAQVNGVKGEHCCFFKLDGFQTADTQSLVFLQAGNQFDMISAEQPAVIVTSKEIAEEIGGRYGGTIICVFEVRLAQALIKQHYADYLAGDLEWPAIHPTATLHPSSSIGAGCRIGPGVVIGADCVIGKDTIIRSNSVIEHGCQIGEGCVINSLVNIGYASELGQRVIIQSGCIISGEGYGFATDAERRHHRIPHTGKVVIGDDVQVGNNSCIDRATYGTTLIGRGVKIDNLCHIAHNVQIGEDSLITAQTVIAGSSIIGKRVITSGQTGILDHISVADDSVLVHRAGVSQDIIESGMWAGTPAKPIKDYVKTLGLGKKVSRLERKIKTLESQIDAK